MALGLLIVISGCATNQVTDISAGHLSDAPDSTNKLPDISESNVRSPVETDLQVSEILETYTVTVSRVPIKELLFALARDADVNIDIYDDIDGLITINAIDQTLPQILDRIARQSDIRYQIEEDTILVSADKPYLHTYKVPYVNMSRHAQGHIDSSTQIASSGFTNVGDSRSGMVAKPNISTISINNVSKNDFWQSLHSNIASILQDHVNRKDENPQLNNNIVVNRESGLISIRAKSKQHAEIKSFIGSVLDSIKRQVLIEATVVEVNLSDRYQGGVDWSRISGSLSDTLGKVNATQSMLGGKVATTPTFTMSYADQKGKDTNVTATVRLLKNFGDVKVLSSPKIMVLNNQTSILKVVDNRVYFTIGVDITQNETQTVVTYETDIHTVPVGLVVSLIPYISDSNQVILNIRPTISRILQFVNDPNPTLAEQGIESHIPEIQVREMESVLKLNNGQVAVIGGLMQDSSKTFADGVPGISRVPGLGKAFKYRDKAFKKTELVIFLRTTVIKDPSLDGDLKGFTKYFPTSRPGDS